MRTHNIGRKRNQRLKSRARLCAQSLSRERNTDRGFTNKLSPIIVTREDYAYAIGASCSASFAPAVLVCSVTSSFSTFSMRFREASRGFIDSRAVLISNRHFFFSYFTAFSSPIDLLVFYLIVIQRLAIRIQRKHFRFGTHLSQVSKINLCLLHILLYLK